MRNTLAELKKNQDRGEKLVMLTCYDASFAALCDAAGVELLSGLLRDRFGYGDARFAAATTLEELLELLGVAFFLRALVLHMAEARTLEHLVLGSRHPDFTGAGAVRSDGPAPPTEDASA